MTSVPRPAHGWQVAGQAVQQPATNCANVGRQRKSKPVTRRDPLSLPGVGMERMEPGTSPPRQGTFEMPPHFPTTCNLRSGPVRSGQVLSSTKSMMTFFSVRNAQSGRSRRGPLRPAFTSQPTFRRRGFSPVGKCAACCRAPAVEQSAKRPESRHLMQQANHVRHSKAT